MRSSFSLRRRKGFSLVEVILAVGVVSMAILALVGLIGSTFTQVDDVVQTNRALAIVNSISNALDNPKMVGGQKIPNADDKDKTAFEVVYEAVQNATSTEKYILYCYNRQIDSDDSSKGMMTVVYKAAGDNFDFEKIQELKAEAPLYRVEITISSLLEGQKIWLDTETAEQKDQQYSSGALPGVNEYALAYLPLLLEIYSHDISIDSETQKTRDVKPVLSQIIVINR